MIGIVCETCGCVVPIGEEKTLLDEFAMAAMIGVCAVSAGREIHGTLSEICTDISKQSYSIAAAMMAERAKRDEMGNVKGVK